MLPFILGISETQAVQQNPVKLLEIRGASPTDKYIAEGNRAFIHGDFHAASAAYDSASLADLMDPNPWVNGALATSRLGRFNIAKRSWNHSRLLGDRSFKGQIIGSEIDANRGQYEGAIRRIRDVLIESPNDAYALLGMSNVLSATSQTRQAERFRWQALRSGSIVMLDSDQATHQPGLSVSLGSANQFQVGSSSQTSNFINRELFLSEALGSIRSTQQLATFDSSFNAGWAIIQAQLHHLSSERPGDSPATNFLPNTPGSKLDFTHETIGLLRQDGPFSFHASYRHESSDLRASWSAPFVRDNLIDQWILESRYDFGNWISGLGFSEVHKSANPFGAAIEPLEAILPDGITTIYQGYLVNRQSILNKWEFTSGAVFSGSQGVLSGGAQAELSKPIGNGKSIRIGMHPGIRAFATNLGPISVVNGNDGSNPVDRLEQSALGFNRNLSLPSLNGRSTDGYLTVPLAASSRFGLEAFGTIRSFSQTQFVGANPVASNRLVLSNISRGQSLSFGLRAQSTLNDAINGSIEIAATQSRANYSQQTVDTAGNPTSESRLPNTPNLEARASVDWSSPSITGTLTAAYAGTHIQSMPVATPYGPRQLVQNVPGSIKVDSHWSWMIGDCRASLHLFNLAQASFFRGYQEGRSVSFELGWKK